MTSPSTADGAAGVAVPIIIPVHNKATITRQCLEALLAEPDGLTREIVVVDDGSTDSTPQMLAAFGERVRVIRNESALGFAAACNSGAAAAGGDLFVLLNNDTIPTHGWLTALVNHALLHPAAAVIGAKLLFPNDTIQHAGVVFGLDLEPHHIYAGFPANHPAAAVTRRFQAVTAACALFRRQAWEELGGLSTDYRNGWEDVDYCMRAGEAGHEIHYCAESVVYHFESATRDLLSATERANRALFNERWRDKIDPDDFGYYWADGLISAVYGARYPIQLSLSPLLAGMVAGENDRLADKLLYERARQVMILLRNNIILNVRVQDAEARAAASERRLAETLAAVPTERAGAQDRADEGVDPDETGAGAAGAGAPAAAAPDASQPVPAEQERVDRGDEPIADPAAHQIVGRVESPGSVPDVVIDGLVRVSGWASSRAGGTRIETIIDGEPRGEVTYGLPRPEIAALYPALPEGEACGFEGEISVADLPDGWHALTIRISAADGAHAELSTRFEIDHRAHERGRLLGRVEAPPPQGIRLLPREILAVSGWALSPSGIREVEVFIDGQSRGTATYGSLRPDIGRIARQYRDAERCGFHGAISIFGIEDGSYELAVKITANDGQVLELNRQFWVDSASVIDGGLPIINRQYATWLDRRANARVAPETAEPGLSTDNGSPVFEAVVALDGSEAQHLQAFIASIRAQEYGTWRLTLLDHGCVSANTRELAAQEAGADERISVVRPPAGTSLAEAWREAARGSTSDWFGFFRGDIRLAPEAFAAAARAVAEDSVVDVIYSDDDRLDPATGQRWNPFFKPDWSPHLLLAMNYLGPLTLYRRALLEEIGWLGEGIPGAEHFDLALRATERARAVRHLPQILVTTIESAPAHSVRWPTDTWLEAERDALRAALERRQIKGIVERGLHPGRWRIRYPFPEFPGVTVVIPTGGNLDLLRRCLDDLLHGTNYPNLEVVIVDNSTTEAVATFVAEVSARYPRIQRIAVPIKPFNFSALINAALPLIATPYALLLNDDIGVIDADWLTAMVELATRPEVGIVGAKLLFPDDTIQHAGVVLGPYEGSVHVFKRFPGHDPGFFDLPDVTREVSAVTFACALIDRAVFDTIGGLDENLPVAFNDTDFCLRTREAGYEVLYTPHATLYHHESVTKTVIAHPHEIAFLRNRWGRFIDHDPYYNPNLSRRAEDARLNMETIRAR